MSILCKVVVASLSHVSKARGCTKIAIFDDLLIKRGPCGMTVNAGRWVEGFGEPFACDQGPTKEEFGSVDPRHPPALMPAGLTNMVTAAAR